MTLTELYDAHVRDVYRFVYRRCQDAELSEDITQETFLSIVHGPLDPDSIGVGWLLTVARNKLFDVLRRQGVYEEKLRLSANGEPESETIDVVAQLSVEQAMQQLSVDHRLVLTLHYVDGYTVPAIAQNLDRSVKSVEGLVTRARRALRKELVRQQPERGTGVSEAHKGHKGGQTDA